ncbi:hypothetical protein E2C01_040558 [Portunus trituberculatus]|uniref:Uncharacterized protein n=1 Tax=Portunus trituberculatus TaxID=210409 RepID=A0A5B7FPI7_PORTR|nr:hypothetical protein [Portunus trituberculatus]
MTGWMSLPKRRWASLTPHHTHRYLHRHHERPPKETVSPESHIVKCLVDQWEALIPRGEILYRRWTQTGEVSWLMVVPLSKYFTTVEQRLEETYRWARTHLKVSGQALPRLRQEC